MQLIDTHVHLNFDVYRGELDSLVSRWQSEGVVHTIHSCVEPKEFEAMREIADRCPGVSLSVGLHPLDAEKWEENSAEQITALARSDRRVVAIGETGLDFYKSEDRSLQKEVFWEQLKIAHELDKPVIIHCRDAAATMREMIARFKSEVGPIQGVMHCWSGTPEETQWFLDLGFYISFSGIVTFKNATNVHESVKIVPDERILIETDCPFLAPNPKRGKRNEPSYVRYVAERVAQLRGVSLEDLARATTENACRLFQLSLT
ncbi:MAG: D-aminoacyl-tRNA deacylase [Chroococcopsis gigantea SAG 12.99]|jgi:TatD DNase family protein|nr:TatD family hydrolase [Chlorogloea purpurea SAG 13.99]MDV3001206.1 D-aminoacyl-tRNA deacylase [Chroococcopsis gigantea SAG 12.99]